MYLATGIDLEGRKDVLGLCGFSVGEHPTRFPQAMEAVFPGARVQLCIAHIARARLNYGNWKESKLVAAHLKSIYRAAGERRRIKNWTSP